MGTSTPLAVSLRPGDAIDPWSRRPCASAKQVCTKPRDGKPCPGCQMFDEEQKTPKPPPCSSKARQSPGQTLPFARSTAGLRQLPATGEVHVTTRGNSSTAGHPAGAVRRLVRSGRVHKRGSPGLADSLRCAWDKTLSSWQEARTSEKGPATEDGEIVQQARIAHQGRPEVVEVVGRRDLRLERRD